MPLCKANFRRVACSKFRARGKSSFPSVLTMGLVAGGVESSWGWRFRGGWGGGGGCVGGGVLGGGGGGAP